MVKCDITRSVKQNFASSNDEKGLKKLVFMRLPNKFV